MRCCFLFTSLLSLVLVAGTAELTEAQVSSASLSAKTDALFANWNKPGSPGAAVGVVHQGKLIYAKGFGEADLETGARISPETIFHGASLAKQFTAYAIVLLVQQKKLSLDDDIRTYLPEVPDFGKTITIRHLIHHVSGLRDQWALLSMSGRRLDDVITKGHIFNLIERQRELNFEPGSEFSYSNTNYTLLAEIVSRVGKQPFPDWMRGHVFFPLGMKSTSFNDDHERIVKHRAYSFYKAPDLKTGYKKSVLSYANAGATSLFTTVRDLAKWMANFHKTQLGDSATMVQVLERGRLAKGDTLPYSFALFHSQYKGLDHYWHNGADAGYRSFMCYFPKDDYGFIVLSNAAEFNAFQSAYDLADMYLAGKTRSEQPVKPAAVSVDAKSHKVDKKRLDQYAGEYQLAPGYVLSFRREGERFLGQAPGQPPSELLASSDTTFLLKEGGGLVTFHPSANGKAMQLTLHQHGTHIARRVEPYTPAQAELQSYAGTYYSPELETMYTIRLKNDTLLLSHIQYGNTPLKPLAKDRLETPWRLLPSFDLTQTVAVVRNTNDVIIGLRITNQLVRNLWFRRLADDFGQEQPAKADK